MVEEERFMCDFCGTVLEGEYRTSFDNQLQIVLETDGNFISEERYLVEFCDEHFPSKTLHGGEKLKYDSSRNLMSIHDTEKLDIKKENMSDEVRNFVERIPIDRI